MIVLTRANANGLVFLFFHFLRPYLLQDIPGYHAVTVPHPDGFTWILDWPGPVPPDGYGEFSPLENGPRQRLADS